MRLALFTPWPPQRSGIADYAYRLAEGLAQRAVDVEVFTAAPAPVPLPGCAIHTLAPNETPLLGDDTVPVFQLGNNVSFHAFQPAAMARLGGLVHLHDPVLHHLHVDRTLAAGDGGYWTDLEYWYGPRVAKASQRLVHLGTPPWTNAAATAIPMFEPYLQYADAVLVHSQAALESIRKRMPTLRGYCLPQCYPANARVTHEPRARGDSLRLGVFGLVEPHKRLDQILSAMRELRGRGVYIRLDIVGSSAAVSGIADQISEMGLASAVRLHGHVEHEAFISAIANVDVCVNLRDPTMGETSAVVVHAMQLGVPAIVTNTGWYAELPDFVLKVPRGAGAVDALVEHLERLDADRDLLRTLAEATARYATTELDFDRVVGRYVAMLAEVAGERSRRRMVEDALYRDVAVALADIGLSDAPAEASIKDEILGVLRPCI